jgi:hypothetical protein
MRVRRRRLGRHFALVVLAVTAAGLALGLILRVAGSGVYSGAVWAAVGGCGTGYAPWAMADALRHGRVGVVILGGGAGGTLAANRLRHEFGDAAAITVVDRNNNHIY